MQAVFVVQHLSALTVSSAQPGRLKLQAAAQPNCLPLKPTVGMQRQGSDSCQTCSGNCHLLDMLTGAGHAGPVNMSAYSCGAPVRGPAAVSCMLMTLCQLWPQQACGVGFLAAIAGLTHCWAGTVCTLVLSVNWYQASVEG